MGYLATGKTPRPNGYTFCCFIYVPTLHIIIFPLLTIIQRKKITALDFVAVVLWYKCSYEGLEVLEKTLLSPTLDYWILHLDRLPPKGRTTITHFEFPTSVYMTVLVRLTTKID